MKEKKSYENDIEYLNSLDYTRTHKSTTSIAITFEHSHTVQCAVE